MFGALIDLFWLPIDWVLTLLDRIAPYEIKPSHACRRRGCWEMRDTAGDGSLCAFHFMEGAFYGRLRR